MNTQDAVELRSTLEFDILKLLQAYRDATGLTPTSVWVNTNDLTLVGDARRTISITGVRVTVEV